VSVDQKDIELKLKVRDREFSGAHVGYGFFIRNKGQHGWQYLGELTIGADQKASFEGKIDWLEFEEGNILLQYDHENKQLHMLRGSDDL
jgi:hypothetical protein